MHATLTLSAVFSGLALFAWGVLRLRRWIAATRIRRRQVRGARGQRAARSYLERRGYRVLAEEQPAAGLLEIDGEALDYEVRIDYLVARRGKVFGVEVKTGRRAVDPRYRATRRQLLEYFQLFPIDGLFLLDMETPRLMEVRFPGAARARSGWTWILLVGFALGAGAATLVRLM